MGVKGLWRLLLPIGRRVSIETLQGKVLAVDASIWLTQFLKAMRNKETGQVQAAAHLIGFFRRLCRLSFHGIRPVFVFDGATPEIKQRELALRRKRREQFATLGDASVQRLAKKLLADTLKKQKQSKDGKAEGIRISGGGAFVAGFNPGREHQQQTEDQVPDVSGTKVTDAAPNEQTKTKIDEEKKEASNDSSTEKNPPMIELLKEEGEEGESEKNKLLEEVNDWDNPILVDSEEEEQRQESSSSDSDDQSVEYEDFGVPRNEMRNRNRTKNGELSIRHISSLSPDKRKDAIEEAKRRQRLRSRTEFMPAAAHPLQFSQVQVSNFLRSSRLNQSIVKMATQAAEQDNRGLRGDVMASDRTTRVELIRERDDKVEIHAPKALKGRLKRASKPDDSLQEDSSRSDESWTGSLKKSAGLEDSEDNSNGQPAAKESSRSRRRVFAIDDSSSEGSFDGDGDGGGGFLSSYTPISRRLRSDRSLKCKASNDADEYMADDLDRKPAAKETVPTVRRQLITINESSDESDDRGEGFMLSAAAHSRPSVVPTVEFSRNKPCVTLNDVDDASDMEPGGFLLAVAQTKVNSNKSLCQTSKHGTQENSGARGAPPEKKQTRDARLAQELSDRALAEALQVVEDTETAELEATAQSPEDLIKGPRSRGLRSSRHPNNDVDGGIVGRAGSRETSTIANRTQIPASKERLRAGLEGYLNERADEGEDDDDDIGWEDGASQKDIDCDVVVDDGSVGWEDGEISTTVESREEGMTASDLGREANANPTEGPSGKIEKDVEEAVQSDSEDSWGDSATSPKIGLRKDPSYNAETNAALERAQATASNLADWAGRVFKRAIKEANQSNDGSPDRAERATTEVDIPKTKDEGSPSEVHDVQTLASLAEPSSNLSAKTINDDSKAAQAATSSDARITASCRFGSVQVNRDQVDDANLTRDFQLNPETLEQEERDWEAERNQRERDMDTVTDDMRDEVIKLLQLFGVPYVEAPTEAEAQCVALEQLGLVDGIVTDDSDVFVFGGQTVYKNIFDEMKYVEVYHASDAEKEMSLGRNQMLALAMLLGGDYTEGVKGVGIVNAMEVLQTFDVTSDLKAGLGQFKKWLDGFDPVDAASSTSGTSATTRERLFHSKHRSARTRWVTPESFPSDRVITAYRNPVVDKSETPFSWGTPDFENLINFCGRNIGWSAEEAMKLLDPILSTMKTGYRQTRLDSFMKYDDGIKFADIKSKRLRDVLGLAVEKESGASAKKQRTRK